MPYLDLGFIIPYQVITGNYDRSLIHRLLLNIIPYQVITGNYDFRCPQCGRVIIIPYQVITGNYDSPYYYRYKR